MGREVALTVNEVPLGRPVLKNLMYLIQVLKLLCTCRVSSLRDLGMCLSVIKTGIISHGERRAGSRRSQGRKLISRLI